MAENNYSLTESSVPIIQKAVNDVRGMMWQRRPNAVPRGGLIQDDADIHSFKITLGFRLGESEEFESDGETRLRFLPRCFGTKHYPDFESTEERLYFTNCPGSLTENQLNCINFLYSQNDIVMAAKWEDGYLIVSPPIHTRYIASWNADTQRIRIGTSTIDMEVVFPFGFESSVPTGWVHVLWDWNLYTWYVVAATCPLMEV